MWWSGHPARRRAAAAMVVALVLSALASCTGSASDAATATTATTAPGASPSSTGEATTTVRPRGAADGEECGRLPTVAPARDDRGDVFDDVRLRGTPAEVRLPDDAGVPVAIVPLAGGAIVLEADVDGGAAGEGGVGASPGRTPTLLLRRLDGDGSSAWTRRLAPYADDHRTPPALVLDGDLVRVLWRRDDGPLPIRDPSRSSPTTIVLSTVGTDGSGRSDVELETVGGASGPSGVPEVAMALGPYGTAVVGQVGADGFMVRSHARDGDVLWKDRLSPPSEGSRPQLAILADSHVVAASGGQVVRWDPSGRRRWDLDLEPSALVPIVATGSIRKDSADVLLSFDDRRESWSCALDARGSIVLRVEPSRRIVEDLRRAWWTGSGLLVLCHVVAMGHDASLVTVDADGRPASDISVAGGGEVGLGLRSDVTDAAVTDAGDLLLAASTTDYPLGTGSDPDQLESWSSVLRLAAPTGLGDLSQVPLADGRSAGQPGP